MHGNSCQPTTKRTWRQHECLIQHRNMQREEAEKPKRLLYRMKRYRSLLVCDQALLTREKLENDQSSNAEPLSGKPYRLPVGEGSGYAATAARSAATRKQCSGQEIAYNRKVGLRGEMVYAVDLKSIASACGFESHRRHLEIGLWPMPFCGCAVVSPQSASPTAPLVRGGSQLTMWRAHKAETKGR